MTSPADRTVLDRIRARCIEEGDCWLWQGALAGNAKVPQISIDSRKHYVRRLVWELVKDKAPGPAGVSCTCGSQRCINPEHMALTTIRQRAKKAGSQGKYSTVTRAAKIAASKRALHSTLTPEQVADIRYGPGTHAEAGARNGVTRWTAGAIRRGERWKDYSSPFAGLMASNDSTRRATA